MSGPLARQAMACAAWLAPRVAIPRALLVRAVRGLVGDDAAPVGAALVLRDVVQRCLGTGWGLAAISFGTALSAVIAPPALLVASSAAFLLSELADFAVYTPLQRRGLVLAVAASSLVGLAVDSVVFLALAFGSSGSMV